MIRSGKTKKKEFEKIVNIDLEVHEKATSDEQERYDAALYTISALLFMNESGTWGGVETVIKGNNGGYWRTNYWYVLESKVKKTKEEIVRIITNFSLQEFTRLSISKPVVSEDDFKAAIKKEKRFIWELYKLKKQYEKRN